MFKLYKNMRVRDWIALALVFALTFLQVWCTMSVSDTMRTRPSSLTSQPR